MPDITHYLRPDLIATVERLDLRAKFITEGFFAGLHASPYHGFSVEFSEHRKYALGDDLRTIDWQVFGRTDRLYVKKFEAETTLDACWTCCDPTGIDHATGDAYNACGGDPQCEDDAVAGCLNDAVCAKAYSCYETSVCGNKQ